MFSQKQSHITQGLPLLLQAPTRRILLLALYFLLSLLFVPHSSLEQAFSIFF
jgi:hypothetical protein